MARGQAVAVTTWLALAAWGLGPAPASASVRARSYDLEVVFFPDESRLQGRARVELEWPAAPPERLVFYLHGELEVEGVELGGKPVEVTQERVFYEDDYSLVANRVEVALAGGDAPAPLMVRYAGFFHPSRARSPSDYMRIDDDGVLLRSYGYSLWFPVFLEANQDGHRVAFPRVRLTTPVEYTSVFAGSRVEETVDGHLRTSTWRAEDLELFAAQCTALRFARTRAGDVWIYSFRDEGSQAMAGEIASLAARLEGLFGQRYRGDVGGGEFHIMQMPRYGDISSGNVVGITSGIWLGIRSDEHAQRALAHELVHPYVWAPPPRTDPFWSLAAEGFPSYFHLPVLAELLGEPFYDRFLDRIQQLYLDRRQRGVDRRGRPLPPEKPLLEITEAEFSIYKDTFVLADRALLLLDFLRRAMGREEFRAFGRELFTRPSIDRATFEATVLRHLPGARDDLLLWLATTEYPERLRRPALAAGTP